MLLKTVAYKQHLNILQAASQRLVNRQRSEKPLLTIALIKPIHTSCNAPVSLCAHLICQTSKYIPKCRINGKHCDSAVFAAQQCNKSS